MTIRKSIGGKYLFWVELGGSKGVGGGGGEVRGPLRVILDPFPIVLVLLKLRRTLIYFWNSHKYLFWIGNGNFGRN